MLKLLWSLLPILLSLSLASAACTRDNIFMDTSLAPPPADVATAGTGPAAGSPVAPPASAPLRPLVVSGGTQPTRTDPALARLIRGQLGDTAGRYGVVVRRLTDGRTATFNAEAPYYAASLFKLPVMVEVFKQLRAGVLSMEEELTITTEVAAYDLGTLRRQVGDTAPIRALLEEMIFYSDNTAAVLLLDRVGARNAETAMVALGLGHTRIRSGDLTTTAADMAALFTLLAQGRVVDKEASQQMLDLLLLQTVNDRLPAALPQGTLVAHKTGNWQNATHDVGIVYAPTGAYVIAVLSDAAWGSAPIARLSRAVYDYFDGLH